MSGVEVTYGRLTRGGGRKWQPVPERGSTVVWVGVEGAVSMEVVTVSGVEGGVPEDACTLPSEERPLRVGEVGELLATAVRAVERPDAARLRLTLDPRPEVAAQIADLAVRETGCCAFFTFTLTAAADQLLLEVAVPRGRAGVLDGLAAVVEPTGSVMYGEPYGSARGA